MEKSRYEGMPAPAALYLRFTDWLNLAIAVVGGVMLCFMCVAVFASVLSRFAVNVSLAWVEEAATFGLVWVVTLGAALATRTGALTSMELATLYISREATRKLKLAVCVISFVYLVFIIYSGWKMAGVASIQSAPTIPWLSMYWIYVAIPVAGACMFMNVFARLIEMALKKGENK